MVTQLHRHGRFAGAGSLRALPAEWRTDQWLGGGRSSGGARGLGVAALFAQHSRVCRVVDDVLRSLRSLAKRMDMAMRFMAGNVRQAMDGFEHDWRRLRG
ncbi:hypothetical protein [Geopseudomonas aromaticivorans]